MRPSSCSIRSPRTRSWISDSAAVSQRSKPRPRALVGVGPPQAVPFQALTFRLLTSSRSSLLGLKKGILFGGTSTRAPVFGLWPMRPRLLRVGKLPKPRISTLSPDRRARICQWLGKPLGSDRPWSSGAPSSHHEKGYHSATWCSGHGQLRRAEIKANSPQTAKGFRALRHLSTMKVIASLLLLVIGPSIGLACSCAPGSGCWSVSTEGPEFVGKATKVHATGGGAVSVDFAVSEAFGARTKGCDKMRRF